MVAATIAGDYRSKGNRRAEEALPIEVFYNPIGDDKIKVFHAMNSRDGVIEQIR